ncbi:MAG: ATPase [Treponema sp.]|nr:ATPase [Treponema sp.]
MIEKMQKVSIVVLNREREEALKSLRKLGLVHLVPVEGSSETLAVYKEYLNNAVVTESILGEVKLPKSGKKKSAPNISNADIIQLCREIVSEADRKKQILEEISADVAEIDRLAKWGDVNPADFEYLKEKGIGLKLYEVPANKYQEIADTIETVKVNDDKKIIRFLLVSDKNERPENLIPEAFEVPLPRCSTVELQEEIVACKVELEKIQKKREEKAVFLPAIKSFKKTLEYDIQFENINAGMGRETLKDEEAKANDLAWIQGYVPDLNLEEFKAFAKSHDWAVAWQEPENPEEVPTKLKNNKIVSLIYPLTDFLGTVPGYAEYDISGWFLLFFTIFFGMIFGDGGYGLLVTAAFVILSIVNTIKGKKNPALFPLAILLGIATAIWGMVTCTWFGLDMKYIPDWLKALSIPQISNASKGMTWLPFWVEEGAGIEGLTTDKFLMIWCFSLALVQLSVAHIKAMIRNRKSLKALGDFGSMIQLWGMLYVVLMMVVDGTIFNLGVVIGGIPVGLVCVGLVAVGFVLSFVFANYEGNIGESVMASVKNIISVLLGVVNVFSDIVSYIRLWAVGLAGAAISQTVNEMAGPMLGHFILFIAAIVLLVFGHGLNMILNLLSVIVHGVRLNTLEFSTHLGMSWSGFKYEPFSEKAE